MVKKSKEVSDKFDADWKNINVAIKTVEANMDKVKVGTAEYEELRLAWLFLLDEKDKLLADFRA